MNTKNKVFIATSLDGYIADKEGKIDWLHTIPNPTNNDMGYAQFTSSIDAIVMGRTTYETVLGFGIDWPYKKPVYVLSNTLKVVPSELKDKIKLVKGDLTSVLKEINNDGHYILYIDGGKTIQSFLNKNLIDEMIITTIPILIGGGFPLFSDLDKPINFQCIRSNIFLDKIVQNHFVKTK